MVSVQCQGLTIVTMTQSYTLNLGGFLCAVLLLEKLFEPHAAVYEELRAHALLNAHIRLLACMQKTQEQQRVLHAAMLEESGRLSMMHQGTIMSTMLKMFGSMLVNGFVFISIFNGVSNLCTNKVWVGGCARACMRVYL